MFEVIKRYKIFKPGDIVKVGKGRAKKGDYIIIRTKKGYKITKFKYTIKENEIIGKIEAIIKDF